VAFTLGALLPAALEALPTLLKSYHSSLPGILNVSESA
jgi:hypothetical protein